MALPVGVLLSSIIAFGSLSEKYEFVAIKSSGINLIRSMRPIIIFSMILSCCCFLFMNNIYPWAVLKQRNLYFNIKKKKPALALIPGVFNTDIPGYTIKFEERYGENQNLLKNIHISELEDNFGKTKVITAERGEITAEEGSPFLKLKLLNGNFYQEHLKKKMSEKEKLRMPASVATFESYILNLDISSFNENDLYKTQFKNHYGMLSLKQLDSISKIIKIDFDKQIHSKTAAFFNHLKSDQKSENESFMNSEKAIHEALMENLSRRDQKKTLGKALGISSRIQNKTKNGLNAFKTRRKVLNLYDFEYNYRITFSMACLVLFFIGAPLGAIIRKGGFGMPLLVAIVVFVSYFMMTQLGKNLAEESAVSSTIGGWLSTLIMLPLGILLTQKTSKGVDINLTGPFKSIFKNIQNKFNAKKQ